MKWMVIFYLTLISVVYGKGDFKDKTDKKFQNSCLKEHNTLRTKHHSPDLKVDEQDVEHAKARCLEIAAEGKGHAAEKSDKGDKDGYGENRYWGASASSEPAPCKDALDNWYKKAKGYDYKSDGKSATFGFTQLVWKETTSLGCARCSGKENGMVKTHIVCVYKPRGNYKNKFAENVLKP